MFNRVPSVGAGRESDKWSQAVEADGDEKGQKMMRAKLIMLADINDYDALLLLSLCRAS